MTAPESLILYERDDDGVPFAVEEVRAERWEPRFAVPPDAASADVRVVRLARGPVPPSTPRWLAVDLGAGGVAEDAATYVSGIEPGAAALGTPARGPGARAFGQRGSASRRLWPWSPHHRRPTAALAEFLRAGATALRYPEPPPVEADRQAEALRTFARGREAFAPLISLRADALERWLHVTFREPECFADAVLVARIEVVAPREAAMMRFLRQAVVPHAHPHAQSGTADLAVDRMVLLEQTSPWRTLGAVPMTAAFAAAQSWQRRFRRAYEEHYRHAVAERDQVLRAAEASGARLSTLERLNAIAALGTPEGEEAIVAARTAHDALAAMPVQADAEAATTAGVLLGEPNALARAALEATEAVERALLTRLRRLSGALAACALGHDDDLRAVLDAIALSQVDHLDRVLDERLAARIEALLTAAAHSPLTLVARQFPEVTLANLEAAVEEFRRATRHAIDTSPEGRTALAGAPPRAAD